MLRLPYCFLIVVVFLPRASIGQAQERISERERSAVFEINTYRAGNKVIGSGFAVNANDGVISIITAGHVVNGADSIFIRGYGNAELVRGELLDVHSSYDIALLSIKGEQNVFLAAVTNPEVGDPAELIEPNSDYQLAEGNKSGTIYLISPLMIQVKGLVIKDGDSGAPVFTGKGMLGMISLTADSKVTIIPIDKLRKVLEEWEITASWSSYTFPHKVIIAPTAKEKPMNIRVTGIDGDGKCGSGVNLTIDNNESTAWRCTGNEYTRLFYYFDGRYSIEEFRIFIKGDVAKTNTDIPDGYFRIAKMEVSIPLKKLLYSKKEIGDDMWVTYKLKKPVVSDYFCLVVTPGSVNQGAIYEIKITGIKY